MEHELPGDLILIVLRKLALQDPLSFVRATCACKTFQKEAEDDSNSWFKALFKPEDIGEGVSKLDRRFQERNPGFEAAIEQLGGYKQLVKARWGRLECFAFEQTPENEDLRLPKKPWKTHYEESEMPKYLIILKVSVKPLFWGVLPRLPPTWDPRRDCDKVVFRKNILEEYRYRLEMYVHASRLEPVYPGVSYEELSQGWAKRGIRFQDQNLSLEVFEIPGQGMMPEQSSRRVRRRYDCFLFLREMTTGLISLRRPAL